MAAAKPRPSAWGAAWLLLKDSGEAVSLQEFCDLLYGNTEPLQLSACWLALVGGQQWFRWKQCHVQARTLEELKPLRRERRLKAIAEEEERRWLQLLKRRQSTTADQCSALHLQWLELLKETASGRRELSELPDGLRQSLSLLHLTQERSQLRHLLVDLGQWDPHQLLSLAGTVWSEGFSESLVLEAQRLEAEAEQAQPSDPTRVDLCQQRCVTIDDDDTRDIDDGLAIEKTAAGRTRIWIHVADPGRLIHAGSPLDLEARKRASSLYLAHGNVPMFPDKLSTGVFSLRA